MFSPRLLPALALSGLLAAEGVHFSVEIPAPDIISSIGLVEPGLSVRVKARSLDGGRWAIDKLVVPSPINSHMLSDVRSEN